MAAFPAHAEIQVFQLSQLLRCSKARENIGTASLDAVRRFCINRKMRTGRRARADLGAGQEKNAAALRIKLKESEERGRDGCPGYAKLHSRCPQASKLKMIATKQTKTTHAAHYVLVV